MKTIIEDQEGRHDWSILNFFLNRLSVFLESTEKLNLQFFFRFVKIKQNENFLKMYCQFWLVDIIRNNISKHKWSSILFDSNKDKPSIFYTLQKTFKKVFYHYFGRSMKKHFPRVTLREKKTNFFCEIPFLVQNSLPCLSNSDDLAIQVWPIGKVMRRGFKEHHMMQVPITENQLGSMQMKQ